MRILVVAAHPDDEVLGAGATIHKVSKEGHEVYVCLLSHWSPTRDDNLEEGIKISHEILGVEKAYIGDFGCMRFKDEDHHAIVRFIEAAITDCQPDVLITHHPHDIHIDHGVTSECCMEAAKLPMRQICSIEPIKSILFMEVPSSTDWNINTADEAFRANTFMEVDGEDVTKKCEAICIYKDVMRQIPHPRSMQALSSLANVRGSQAGVVYAEGFQQAFRLGV